MNAITRAATSPPITRVPFHGGEILAIAGPTPSQTMVIMKPIVEALGLDWEGQRKKIERHPVLDQGASIMEAPSAGGPQAMLCLPLSRLSFWLATLTPSKIKEKTIREAIIIYQSEAADVLFRYFFDKATKSDAGELSELHDPKTARRRLIEALQREEQLEEQIEALETKVTVLDRITADAGDMTLTIAAKTLRTGRGRMVGWMLRNGCLFRKGRADRLIAYQPMIDRGLLRHVEAPYTDQRGEERWSEQVRVTKAGLAWLSEHLPVALGGKGKPVKGQLDVQPGLPLGNAGPRTSRERGAI